MKLVHDHIRLCSQAYYHDVGTALAIKKQIIPHLQKSLAELREAESTMTSDEAKQEWLKYGMYQLASDIEQAIETAKQKLIEQGYIAVEQGDSHE